MATSGGFWVAVRAEIEQLAKDSLFDGLEEAYKALVPLSETMREEVKAMREWAKNRARFANTEEEELEMVRKVTPLTRKKKKAG